MNDAFTTRLSNTLREKLEAEARDIGHGLASTPVGDYATYRERVGQAKGLRRAMEMLSEIEKSLSRAEDVERAVVAPKRYEE